MYIYICIYTHTHIYIYVVVETAIAVPTWIMLVGTAIAVSTGRIADSTRTILPYLGRNCDLVKAVIVLTCLAIYGNP